MCDGNCSQILNGLKQTKLLGGPWSSLPVGTLLGTGWRLGAKANTFPSCFSFCLLPAPPSWGGECNFQRRVRALILDVCCFTRVKGSRPPPPFRAEDIHPLGTLEIGRHFVPLPVSLISLCIFISVDKKEEELPSYQDPLFIVLQDRPLHGPPISD